MKKKIFLALLLIGIVVGVGSWSSPASAQTFFEEFSSRWKLDGFPINVTGIAKIEVFDPQAGTFELQIALDMDYLTLRQQFPLIICSQTGEPDILQCTFRNHAMPGSQKFFEFGEGSFQIVRFDQVDNGTKLIIHGILTGSVYNPFEPDKMGIIWSVVARTNFHATLDDPGFPWPTGY